MRKIRIQVYILKKIQTFKKKISKYRCRRNIPPKNTLICTYMYTYFRAMDLFYEILNFVLFAKKCVMYFKQICYDIISPHRYDANCFLQNICCVIIRVRPLFFKTVLIFFLGLIFLEYSEFKVWIPLQ